jgi:hypothetical protein
VSTRAARLRRRRLVAGVVVVAALGVLGAGLAAFPDRDRPRETGAGSAPRSELVALAVTGAPHALLAVVGSGPAGPVALVLPPRTTVVVPGQGETVAEAVQALPGDSVRIALGNLLGTWIDGYAVLDLDRLAGLVDRAGGLELELPEPVELLGRSLPAGPARLSGAEVAALLGRRGPDALLRATLVLEAFLADPPSVEAADLLETDGAARVARVLRAAGGARVDPLPTETVGARVHVLEQPAADELVGRLLGTRPPLRLEVLNGSGRPNVGEEVARRLLPLGVRVVLSRNAESFDHERTEILATDPAFAEEAERVRRALGVGAVSVSGVPSGLADITIVVGRDLEA